ncbi:MAG: Rnase Y domain-containing protein, partial [Bacilli bacterium]|nr:Rnase Y domain-containing protein [Bacilli bacterium]
MENIVFSILLVLVGLFVGIITTFLINYIRGTISSKKAEMILENAKNEAAKIKRDHLLEAKEESYKIKSELEKEIKEKKTEMKEAEERLIIRENNIDRRDQIFQKREQMLEERENNLIEKQKDIQTEQMEIESIKNDQIELLEKIASFSKNEARDLVMKKVEEMMNLEIAAYIKDREDEAKIVADKQSKNLLVNTMQRYASDVANEQTVTVVSLPSDDMKGRIIGREGRNIRTLEAVTGVDLIIDDTPEAFVLSSFDPYRREIARVTIETLIKDGRIHPARIE